MFNAENVLVLAKAGFTAQQIAGLSMLASQSPAPAPAVNNPVPAPAVNNPVPPQPAPVPAAPAPAPQLAPVPAAPAPAPQPVPAQAPVPQPVDPVLAELQKLTGLVQGSNIMNVNQPKVQTAEEILAEIINPAPKGDK